MTLPCKDNQRDSHYRRIAVSHKPLLRVGQIQHHPFERNNRKGEGTKSNQYQRSANPSGARRSGLSHPHPRIEDRGHHEHRPGNSRCSNQGSHGESPPLALPVLHQLQKLRMHSRVRAQLRVEGCGHRLALAHQHRIAITSGQNFHVLARALDLRCADEH